MALKTSLVGILAALVLLPNANATPGTATGAIVFGTGAAIICDHVVRSYMDVTPESDEAWYLVWHHVGPEDVAGFAAGTTCAIPAAAAGAAVGLAVEATVVGASATAAGTGVVIVVGKGLHRALAPPTKRAMSHVRNVVQSAKRWYGQVKFGPVASSSIKLRRQHMEFLYEKQKGLDALCKVPLPPLYVGPLWKRKLNPKIHIDHRLPKARGGTDDLSNLQLTFSEFNLKKGTLTGYELRSAKRKFCTV